MKLLRTVLWIIGAAAGAAALASLFNRALDQALGRETVGAGAVAPAPALQQPRRRRASPESVPDDVGASEQGFVDKIDHWQQSVPPLAFPYAVVKKFGDVKAGNLAALIAYYGFFSIFPLLLSLITILAFVLGDNPQLQEDLVDSALGQFPLVGDTIGNNVGEAIEGNVFALVIGLGTALWAGLGAMQAATNAMNTVWDVPRKRRANAVKARIRAVLMLVFMAFGLVGSTAVVSIAAALPDIGPSGRFLIYAGNLAVNIGLYLVGFRLLVDVKKPIRQHLPGAIVAGTGYFLLQLVGASLMENQVDKAGDTYGTFAIVIGLLTWLFILSQLSIFAAVINVVSSNRLWPRSINGNNLSDGDRRASLRYLRATPLVDPDVLEVAEDLMEKPEIELPDESGGDTEETADAADGDGQ